MAVLPDPDRVPSQSPLAPSVTSVANDKDDPEGCAQISWHLSYCLGKPRKTSARRPSDEGCASINRLKWDSAPPKDVVGSHSTLGKDNKTRKERKEGFNQNEKSHS